MKLWYNVPILISLFQHILSYDGIRLVEEVGSTLCPYTDYCHTNSSREMNETLIYDIPIMRSCLPCSCDNDCWELHTCCPDKEEIIPEPAQLPCTQSKVKERPDDDDDPSSILDILNQRAGANYKIVDSCPSSENNETLKRKCEGLDPKTLSDYIWVSDGTTGRIYQNVHCIKCHGIKQIWYWNFQTSCQGVLDTAMNIEDVMLSVDCDITNAVPEDRKALVAKYQCFDFEHERTFESDCNVSSVSGDLIKNFMTACHKSTWPYMTGSTPVKMYKNVFCYVCQFGFDAVRDVFMMMETAVSFGGRSFSALINYVDSQNSNMNYQPHTCYSSQVYDPYVSKCRDLMCPFGKYPHYGNCEHKFSGLKSTCLCVELSINILLDYDIQQLNSSATSDVLDNMKNEIVNHILDLVNRINPGCNRKQVFNTKLSIDGTAPTLNVSLRVKLGPRCDVYNVTDMVIDLTGKTTLERLNNNTVDISLYLDKCNEAFPVDLDCRVTLRLDNNMTCSHIELFLSDVDEFSHKQQMERAVFLTFFDRTMALSKTTAVNVCVENYLKQMIIASGGCSISDELKIFVLFSMLSNCLITLSMYM